MPLIWMFLGKPLINKICKIHHRTLQVVCNYFNVVNSFCRKQYFHVLVLIHYDSDGLFHGITDLRTSKTVNV